VWVPSSALRIFLRVEHHRREHAMYRVLRTAVLARNNHLQFWLQLPRCCDLLGLTQLPGAIVKRSNVNIAGRHCQFTLWHWCMLQGREPGLHPGDGSVRHCLSAGGVQHAMAERSDASQHAITSFHLSQRTFQLPLFDVCVHTLLVVPKSCCDCRCKT
jgi:hypothetical protein